MEVGKVLLYVYTCSTKQTGVDILYHFSSSLYSVCKSYKNVYPYKVNYFLSHFFPHLFWFLFSLGHQAKGNVSFGVRCLLTFNLTLFTFLSRYFSETTWPNGLRLGGMHL